MKNPLKIMLAVIAMGLLIGTSAQAVMISSGSRLDIGVSQVTLDTGNLDTANAVTNWGTALVTLATGDFSSVPLLSAATMATPWTFVNATPNLWSVGGFSFSLDAGAVITRTPPPPGSNFLNVSGTGTITGIGFDPTPGVWSFTATSANGGPQSSFTFTADTAAQGVPDGGTTVALLGVALAGLEGARRILRRR